MQALHAQDPYELGGHRLLARLGAGGMGVVYLARAADGSLAALKVIRAEHGTDPAFRARFRREARLAGGLTGRWVVPVLGADAEAREPWLATAFVPGPALAEAVDGYGPLPPYAAVALGARLAEALAEVHDAGLVHRDVKPGNVLLALDGPRLIDFGIARDAGATAVTQPGEVVGTPGYLAPEQIRAGGETGAASDVFALGCVLAYAATGRRPFGGGNPATVLYRTVHEEPDLAGLERLPSAAQAAIRGCLAKDPGQRPTAAGLARVLEGAIGPVERPADPRTDPPADPRVDPRAARPADPQASRPADPRAARPAGHAGRDGGPAGPQPGWLPPAILRLVAERSARALDPPPRQPPVAASEEPTTVVAGRPPSRRRALAIGGSAAAVLVASGSGAAVLLAGRGGAAPGGPEQKPRTYAIGLQAALTGDGKEAGKAQERGARLAVAHHNAREDTRFRLALVPYDDRGEAARAEEAARDLVDRRSVRAVIGPTTVAAARAALPVYGGVSMPILLVSVDDDATGLSTVDIRSLCVTRASGSYRNLPVIDYLTRISRIERTALIEDRAGGVLTDDVVRDLRESPPSEGTVTVHPVAADGDGFAGAVTAALAARAEAVVYAGTSPARAAACARAVAAAGFTGPRLAFEPVLRPDFPEAAGDAAEGWVLQAPYTEPQSSDTKAARAFTAAYRKRYGEPPATWAAEAYDAVGLVARSLDALGGGPGITPGQVAERIFRLSYDGVAKPISFAQDLTHALTPMKTGFLYQVEDGRFRFLGRHDELRRPGKGESRR